MREEMTQERLDYLREWAEEVFVQDERDLAHRSTVLELLDYIQVLIDGKVSI